MIVARPSIDFLIEPSTWRRDALGYAAAMALVAATCVSLGLAFGRARPSTDASEVDQAVMIDLPPVEASASPPSDAPDGPVQPAADASTSQPTPEEVRPQTKPVDAPKPPDPAPPPESPPPPAPDPAAVLAPKPEVAAPPKPVVAPPAPAQDARAPAGADTPVATAAETADEGRPQASAHAITVWQKSLMVRLEAAKRAFAHAAHGAGSVKIAFEIDDRGKLVAERVVESSGSPALDAAATSLVQHAAPFPPPPAGAGAADMSFVVPVRFRR